MPLQVIPEDWRKAVCAVLRRGDTGQTIRWTLDASQRFLASPDVLSQYEAYDALIEFLSQPVCMGCRVAMEKPSGETYEFLLPFRGEKFYGKLLLFPDRKSVLIFSCHRALKQKLSCQ
jgi:hypothetical protein